MNPTHDLARRLRQCGLPLFCVTVIGYIGYHTVQGDRGSAARLQLSQKIERTTVELEAVRVSRMELEHRVSLLRSNGLDRDMLGERARAVLGLAHPDDIIFLTR